MASLLTIRMLIFSTLCFIALSTPILGASIAARSASSATSAQPASSFASGSTAPVTGGTTTSPPNSSGTGTSGTTSASSVITTSTAPDVYLNVPELHVGKIQLVVEELSAELNLAAKVAGLVTINAGVAVSVQTVNITITDVDVNLELIVRLGNLVEIVGRVFDSLDLNPLLLSLIGNATSAITEVVGAVDGLLGSVTQGGTTLNFVIDNLGNIVQEVVSGTTGTVSTIVGNYLTNMTQVGSAEDLGNGLTQKTYSYSQLSALVDIIFNAAGQVVQATVQKATGSATTTTTAASATASSLTSSASIAIATQTSSST